MNIQSNANDQIIKLMLHSWASNNASVSKFFQKYPDEFYFQAVAPGRNRAIYLLGHLIAASDTMLPLLGFSTKLFPSYAEIFSLNPDGTFDQLPSISELKENWKELNETLTAHFNTLTPEGWLEKHTAVSDEDFLLSPHRNKLNVLLGRTNHISYHLGQLTFLNQNAKQ